MLTLIAADIFGKTDALEKMAHQLPVESNVVDPYAGEKLSFESEACAYQYFVKTVGMQNYLTQLQNTVDKSSRPIQLLGFSIGATACWKIACSSEQKNIRRAICFYGSQIRHHLDLNPNVKTTAVLPKMEASFDVEAMAAMLKQKEMLELVQTPYLHGFMNAQSDNFCAEAYAKYLHWLQKKLTADDPNTALR